MTDLVGIAALITSITTAIISLGTFRRQGRADRKIKQVHDLVNGVSRELREANQKVDFAEGEKAGIASERAAPLIFAPPQRQEPER